MVATLHFKSLFPTGEMDLGTWVPACQRPEVILMIHRKAVQLVWPVLGLFFRQPLIALELLNSPLITQSFISSVKLKEKCLFYCYYVGIILCLLFPQAAVLEPE